jgi:hypothetical protein
MRAVSSFTVCPKINGVVHKEWKLKYIINKGKLNKYLPGLGTVPLCSTVLNRRLSFEYNGLHANAGPLQHRPRCVGKA